MASLKLQNSDVSGSEPTDIFTPEAGAEGAAEGAQGLLFGEQ